MCLLPKELWCQEESAQRISPRKPIPARSYALTGLGRLPLCEVRRRWEVRICLSGPRRWMLVTRGDSPGPGESPPFRWPYSMAGGWGSEIAPSRMAAAGRAAGRADLGAGGGDVPPADLAGRILE